MPEISDTVLHTVYVVQNHCSYRDLVEGRVYVAQGVGGLW